MAGNQISPSEQRAAAGMIVQRLREAGHEAYWAGGCVRDHLLGRPWKDIDIATSARPERVEQLFDHTLAIGKAFGVIAVVLDGAFYEVATFREETGYADGRRPDQVSFSNAAADALRRDFTINALFYDPETARVLDFVGGQEDLQARRIRAVGDAAVRFGEDHLRMLRAVRFSGLLDFDIEADTWNAICRYAPHIVRVSAERVRDELTRMWTESPTPGRVLRKLHDAGLLVHVLPEVADMVGVEQPPEFHPEGDVFTHTCISLDLLGPPPRSEELVWAVLLHDVGKPSTFEQGEERIRFHGHDRVGADIAQTVLRRLRFSNACIDRVVHCVRNHMKFMHVQEMRRAKLRAMLAAPTFATELELHRVDCLSSHADLSNYEFMQQQMEEWRDQPQLPPRWVRGEDVLALGVQAGPAVGDWLQRAYTRQLDGEATDRDDLLSWLARQIRSNSLSDSNDVIE